jgi:trans-2,3-dihydro-3-hydroxyanthranilate isomerase
VTRFLTLDVFTDTPFGGNPLAVIPDAAALQEAALQRVAREFNYSETAFVLPPADPAHTARLRIFTPMTEVPFAGHPVIGTAVALARIGHGPDMVLELGIGAVAVTATATRARFINREPFTTLGHPAAALVARCLGLEAEQIVGAPVHGGVGLDFVLAELRHRADLSACRTDLAAFRDGAAAHPQGLDFAVMAWTRAGDTIHARMFAPLDNIPEDPATGSAAAALGARLGPGRYTVRQGEDMGRPSRIGVTVAPDGVIQISGGAVPMMEGRLLV